MTSFLSNVSNLDFGIFKSEENFKQFLFNSIVQYVRFKFGGKSEFSKKAGVFFKGETLANNTLSNIIFSLYQESPKEFCEIFGLSHPIEIPHLYSFYKILADLFYEAPWAKNFAPFYSFLFGKDVKILTKKDKRKYASQIITNFDQKTLEGKYLEFAVNYGYPLVIHYGYFITGPLGFLFTPYYREKEILKIPEPLFSVLIESNPEGEHVIDWEKTKLVSFFSVVVKEVKNKMAIVQSECPVYKQYLNLMEVAPYTLDKDALLLSKDFKEKLSRNLIPIWFYEIVQLSGMFFTDEEAVRLLNRLIADDILVSRLSEIDLHYLKVTKDCFILKPKSWRVRPAVDIAKDLSASEEEFLPILTEILKKGATSFLNSLYAKNPEVFSKLLDKRGLYKYSKFEPSSIPREVAVRRLLESYGFQISPQWSFEIRMFMKDYINELKKFKRTYPQYSERRLVNTIVSLLKNGRDHLERMTKEFAYMLIVLITSLKRATEQNIEVSFLFEWPLAMPSIYSRDKDLFNLRREIIDFLRGLLDPPTINKFEQHRFTLGDWLNMTNRLYNHLETVLETKRVLHKELIERVKERLESINLLISRMEKDGIPAQLNKASHEEGRREIMTNVDSRKNAMNILLNFDEVLMSLYSHFPPLARITREVNEIETGLRYYEAKILGKDFNEKIFKIYGTRMIEPSETYYVFTGKDKEEEKVIIYPLLITNLVDYTL